VLKTCDSPTGIVKVTEIVGALARITNLARIAQLATGASPSAESTGYQNLFGLPVAKLRPPNVFIEKAIICLERYLNLVAKTFNHDFPEPGKVSKNSALELTKMFAALMLLLQQFLSEGLDWSSVETEMKKILENVKNLRQVKHYSAVLLKQTDSRIPNTRHRIKDDFLFLNGNRSKPTSIKTVVANASY
jgi:hypothetical protein